MAHTPGAGAMQASTFLQPYFCRAIRMSHDQSLHLDITNPSFKQSFCPGCMIERAQDFYTGTKSVFLPVIHLFKGT